MTILAKLGLMKISEHERQMRIFRADAELITRLRAENARLVRDYAERGDAISFKSNVVLSLEAEVASLRPDAEKWRASLKRGGERRGGKKA